MSEKIGFESIKISGWRQFQDIEIVFHESMTILTGANGAGKSTILTILKSHFPHEPGESFLATPIKENGKTKYSLGYWISKLREQLIRATPQLPEGCVGKITYSSGGATHLRPSNISGMSYQLQRDSAEIVNGISISSHRSLPRYESIKYIPMTGTSPEEAFKDFDQVLKSQNKQARYIKDGQIRNISPLGSIKEALISYAYAGASSVNVHANDELSSIFGESESILRSVLPLEIGFRSIEVRAPEVVITTSSGDFPVDGASGGLMSLIEVSWQLFLYSQKVKSRFVALIDEPENHLHPSMQRSFLPNLLKAFPGAQFIIVTHSPFVVSSVRESSVYALRYHGQTTATYHPTEARSVRSIQLDQVKKAGTASEVLREVLGVPVTIPEWSAHELEIIATDFAKKKISEESVSELRNRLQEAGLSEFFPYAVERAMK